MTLEELKIRQLTNQYLVTKGNKLTVIKDLCGFQAQFLVNAIHSLKLRCSDFNEATLSDGLVKNWTIRGTVHVFAESDISLFKTCNGGKNYRLDEWYGYRNRQTNEFPLSPERQMYFSHIILDSLAVKCRTREELKEICRENGMNEWEEECMFHPWGGGIRELCERGFMNYTVQEKKAYQLCPEFSPMPEEDAKLEIARRYFTNFGPATIKDAMYYTGAKKSEVVKWMDTLDVKSVEVANKIYYYLDNGKSYDAQIPECILLAGFDQLMLGYQKKESIYLPQEYLRGIFNLAGIVMPAILLRGKVVGKWKKKGTKLMLTLFENVYENDKRLILQTTEMLWNDLKKVEWMEE